MAHREPFPLGGATGIRTLAPGFAYNQEFDLDIPVISWVQHFAGGRAGFAVGRLAFDAYLDAFPFQTLSKGSINRSSILNPTLPTTGLGAIGGVVKGFVTDSIWLGAQFHDANAANGKFDFDTVEEGEWIKAIEVGYTPFIGELAQAFRQYFVDAGLTVLSMGKPVGDDEDGGVV